MCVYVIDVCEFWVYQRINEGSFAFHLDPKNWIYRGVQITARVNNGKMIEIETHVSIERVRMRAWNFI